MDYSPYLDEEEQALQGAVPQDGVFGAIKQKAAEIAATPPSAQDAHPLDTSTPVRDPASPSYGANSEVYQEPQVGPTAEDRLAAIQASHGASKNFQVDPDLDKVRLPKDQTPLSETELASGLPTASAGPSAPYGDLMADYKDAKSEGDRVKAVNDMRIAVDQLARGITNTKQDPEWVKRLDAESESPVKDLVTQEALASKLAAKKNAVRDPNSPASKAAQAFLIFKQPDLVRTIGLPQLRGMTDTDIGVLLKNQTSLDTTADKSVGNYLKAQGIKTTGEALDTRIGQGQGRIDLTRAKMDENDDREKLQRHKDADAIVTKFQTDTKDVRDLAIPAQNIERIVRKAGFDPGVVPSDITPGGFTAMANKYAPGMDRMVREQLASGDPAKVQATQDALDQINQQFELLKLAVSRPVTGSNRTGFEDAQWKSIQGSGMLNTPAQKWLYINSVSNDVTHKLAGAEEQARFRVNSFMPPESGKPGYFDRSQAGPNTIRSNDPLLNRPDRVQTQVAPQGAQSSMVKMPAEAAQHLQQVEDALKTATDPTIKARLQRIAMGIKQQFGIQ